jgi:hypothetical protein
MFIFDGYESDTAEPDDDILTFDVPDDALERAAELSSGLAVTVGYCTHWYHCNWPLLRRRDDCDGRLGDFPLRIGHR